MILQGLDFVVIAIYVAIIVFIGIYFKRRAQQSKSEYLLGGNKLPWYMLGLSDASGMFDISGTMWLVTLSFVYGLKSIWIPWLWPTFNQIFLMMFLSAWLRRSNVTTGAEWIQTRFGRGRGSKISHAVVVVFALLIGLSMLAYGFVGLGKFLMLFLPWNVVSAALGVSVNAIPAEYIPHVYGIFFTLLATFYAILGGMVSIVWADVVQYAIMTVSSILIGIIAMNKVSPELLAQLTPEGWNSPFFSHFLDIDWSGKIAEVNMKIKEDGYSLFSLFFGFMFTKGVLSSLAGPAPTYDMQKILATKSPSEALKMSGSVSVILNPVRYFMITGFAILGIAFYSDLNLLVDGNIDFEQILPSAMAQFVPAGLLGLLLVGLLAAFVSTFAGTLNAAQAYISNDIYLKYINPRASEKQVQRCNYTVGISVVIFSTLFGLALKNINEILVIVTSAFYASYMASNILKWYWWRFNGAGYFWGMLTGIISGLFVGYVQLFSPETVTHALPFVPQGLISLYLFPLTLVVSLIGCIVGTYATAPTDDATLMKFYREVRPWGLWQPIYEKVKVEQPDFRKNTRFWKDMANVAVGIVTQTSLVVLPIFVVVRNFAGVCATLAIIAAGALTLKFTWWNKLEEI
ncbi:MAG: Na+:solute symporter [Bacteroidales bacterium]|jgi:Na+/proline symporter|nr:Na+:solute symporter [Bacteroidales bacterium]